MEKTPSQDAKKRLWKVQFAITGDTKFVNMSPSLLILASDIDEAIAVATKKYPKQYLVEIKRMGFIENG